MLANPKTRQLVRTLGIRAAKLAVAGIKKRRQGRINAGKRVVGQRVRDRLLNAGVDLPLKTMAPVAISSSVANAPQEMAMQPLVKQEVAQTVHGHTVFQKFMIPIAAGNDIWFPSCAALASQAMYFKFDWITVKYTPQCSTNATGRFAMAMFADYASADAVSSFGEMCGVKSIQGNIWSSDLDDLFCPSSVMNTQFSTTQGCIIKPTAEADYEDPMQNQGYLVYATEGLPLVDPGNGAPHDGDVIGTLQVKYRVRLLKPKNTLENGAEATVVRLDPDHASFVDVAPLLEALLPSPNSPWHFDATGVNALTVTYSGRCPYLLGVTTTSTDTQVLAATVASGTEHRLISRHDQYTQYDLWLITPTDANSVVTLTSTDSSRIHVHLDFSMARVPRHTATRLSALVAQ